jgi:hypothetical protein
MSNQNIGKANDRKKITIVYFLYLGTLIIVFLGIFFSAYSVLNNISLQILNTSVPGIVFGILVAYLGVRYYLMVSYFKTEFLMSNEKFSWSNFSKEKRKLVKQKL